MKKILFSAITLCILSTYIPASAQLNTSVSGVIWVDKAPLNGIRDAGETLVPGLLVELHDASTDALVSAAITGADGSFTLSTVGGTYYTKYVFPTDGFGYGTFRAGVDNSVNSAVDPNTEQSANFTVTGGSSVSDYGLGLVAVTDTRTYCDSKELTTTNWNKDFSLPKSTQLVSDLTSVKLFTAAAVYHPTIGVENTNATPISPTVEYSGRVTVTIPNANGVGTTNWSTQTLLSKDVTLGAYDGTSDYAGTSGQSYKDEFGSASDTKSYTVLAARNLFTGNDNYTFPTATISVSSIIGAANLQFVVSTTAGAGVCVVYVYKAGVLPVTLVSFAATAQDSKTSKLEWTTTSEANSDRFDIQRSRDGKLWNTIGSVKSKGESKEITNYAFEDKFPVNGQNLYRLRMVDKDATFAFSRIVNLHFEGLPSLVNVYPNPAVSQVFVQTNGNEEIGKVQIFNQAGQLVKESTDISKPFDVNRLTNGIYSVRTIYTNGGSEKNKIVVAH
jgi:hypothetical protein